MEEEQFYYKLNNLKDKDITFLFANTKQTQIQILHVVFKMNICLITHFSI